MSDLLLKVSRLNKSFFGVLVLRDVGFELPRGAVLGLVGENGSGKSTTMNILGDVLTRDSGRVELAGEEVTTRIRATRSLSASPSFTRSYQILTLWTIGSYWTVVRDPREMIA